MDWESPTLVNEVPPGFSPGALMGCTESCALLPPVLSLDAEDPGCPISKHKLLSNRVQLWEKRPGHANFVISRSLVTHSHVEGVQKTPALEGRREGMKGRAKENFTIVFVGRKNDLCGKKGYFRGVFKVILASPPHPLHCWFRFTHWSHNPLMVCNYPVGKHSRFLFVLTSSIWFLGVWRIATWWSKAVHLRAQTFETVFMVLDKLLCHPSFSDFSVHTVHTSTLFKM